MQLCFRSRFARASYPSAILRSGELVEMSRAENILHGVLLRLLYPTLAQGKGMWGQNPGGPPPPPPPPQPKAKAGMNRKVPLSPSRARSKAISQRGSAWNPVQNARRHPQRFRSPKKHSGTSIMAISMKAVLNIVITASGRVPSSACAGLRKTLWNVT